MNWLQPSAFWALAVPVLLTALALFMAWLRRRPGHAFADTEQLFRLLGGVRSWPLRRLVVPLLGLTLIVVALAGPRIGTRVREVRREGIDVVVALDVSTSMLAHDVQPSRLERARNEIKKLLERLDGHRVGLVIFAGEAFIQCPLTTDHNAVRLFLDVAGPDLLNIQGTNFTEAIRVSMRAFENAVPAGDGKGSRVLLIVSDGEDHEKGRSGAASDARRAGIVLFAAGVGEATGAAIPVRNDDRSVGWRRDRQGKTIQTRLDERTLRSLARDGAYVNLGRSSGSLVRLIPALDGLQKTMRERDRYEEYEERFQWPLAVGIFLLVIDAAVVGPLHRRRRKMAEEG